MSSSLNTSTGQIHHTIMVSKPLKKKIVINQHLASQFPISESVLNEKFQQNATKLAMREDLYKSSTYEFIRIGQHVSSLNILFENLDLLIMLPDIKVALESIFFNK